MTTPTLYPRTRGDLRAIAAAHATMTLAEMLDYWLARVAVAESDRQRAHAERQVAKVRASIGVTLGLRRGR